MGTAKRVPTYCYNCVAGPDLACVKVVDGIAVEIEGNDRSASDTPSNGKVCVKAMGLIQKAYNPNRVLTPMKRRNPKKGRRHDPDFVAISWDEALDLVAKKLRESLAHGPRDQAGYPRIACSFGGGGTPTYYMGTLPAFLSTLGPIDFSFGSGQGVKCYHSEHLYGEFWHRAFTVAPDTPNCDYVLSFGYNVDASGGVCGVARHAAARARGAKRVQIEPHQSISAATASEWIAIRPKTDAAFMAGMIHVLLHEQRHRLDLPFLKHRTNAPYLVAPHGFYLRDPQSDKPLIYDLTRQQAVPFDTPDCDPALTGEFVVSGDERGADDDAWQHEGIKCQTSFQKLCDHMEPYTPLWAGRICDLPHKTIRRIALEFLSHARIGETIEIEGRVLPLRPVAVVLGKTVNSGWGGFDSCWGRTLLACLVGGLEVPGGTLGTTVRLNRPATSRQASVRRHPDGFMDYPMNPTDRENWLDRPDVRNANRTLVPLGSNSPWSVALGPTHLAWMQQKEEGPEHWPQATPPDIWVVFRTNPAVSFWDTEKISQVMAKFPFTVCFANTIDETNWMADVLLPDASDIEATQLIRIGGTKFIEQFWDCQGFALRQPAIEPQGESRDMTWIATELARRTGQLEGYNTAINRGSHGVPLKGSSYDFSLDPQQEHSLEAIWDASCRAASAELTNGAESHGLDWWKQHGYRVKPFSRLLWYLEAELQDQNIRWELPYQERLFRIGKELGRRLHERGISWWDEQLEEYHPLPKWKDFPAMWESALARNFRIDIDDYPFWLVTSRSFQYAWGNNAAIQLIREVASNIRGHGGVVINSQRAAELALADGDWVEIRSPVNATRGHIITKQGIRPDTLLMIGQFDHWATPYAKEFRAPSMNALIPMLLDLTDATGSSCDLVKVQLTRLGSGNAP